MNYIKQKLIFLSQFDIIICDEAHRLRNRNTQSYKGAEVIVQHSNAVVLLTATPIMISTENLYNLLHLMDSDRYNDSQNFDNILSSNRPFLHALSSVNNNVPLKEIADTLRKEEVKTSRKIDERCYETSKTVDELYSSVQLYNKIINNCQNCEDTPAVRAQLQYDISTMRIISFQEQEKEKLQRIGRKQKDDHILIESHCMNMKESYFKKLLMNILMIIHILIGMMMLEWIQEKHLD